MAHTTSTSPPADNTAAAISPKEASRSRQVERQQKAISHFAKALEKTTPRRTCVDNLAIRHAWINNGPLPEPLPDGDKAAQQHSTAAPAAPGVLATVVKTRFQATQDQIATLNKTVADTTTQNTRLNEQHQRDEERIRQLEQAVTKSCREAATYKEITEVTARLGDQERHNKKLAGSLKAKELVNHDKQNLNRDLIELQKQLAAESKRNDELIASLQEKDTVGQKNKDLNQDLIALQTKLAAEKEHSAELAKILEEKTAKNGRIAELEEQLSAERDRNTELATAIKADSTPGRIAELEVKLAAERERTAGLQEENDKKVKDWENVREILSNERNILTVANQDMFDRNEELQGKVENLSDDNADLRQHLNRFKSECDCLKVERQKLVKDIETIRKAFDTSARIKTLEDEVQVKHLAIEHLEKQMQEDHLEMLQLDKENDFIIAGCKRFEREGLTDASRVGLYMWCSGMGFSRMDNIRKLKGELITSRKQLSAGIAREQELKTNLTRSRARVEEYHADNVALRMEIADLRNTFNQMKTQLARLQHSTDNGPALEIISFAGKAAEKLASVTKQLETSRVDVDVLKQKLLVHEIDEAARQAEILRLKEADQMLKSTLSLRKRQLKELRNAIEYPENLKPWDLYQEATVEIECQREKIGDLEDHIGRLKNLFRDIGAWYYNETCNVVPQLHKKIAHLMAEKNEDYIVEPHPHPKPWIDSKKMLLTAAMYGKWDEQDFQLHPFDPNENPGCIPATFEVIKKLIPLAWKVIYDLGLPWLTPMYKPFTIEDAQERVRAKEEVARKKLCRELGLPDSEYGRVTINSINDKQEVLVEVEGEVPDACVSASQGFQVDRRVDKDGEPDPMDNKNPKAKELFFHGRFERFDV